MYAYLKPNNKAIGCGDWSVDNEESGSFGYTGLWKDGKVVALIVTEGESEQLRGIGDEIVTACNAHAGLVQAAKVALAMVHGMELAGADKAACEAVAEALENALRVAGINVKERSGMSLSEILDLGITS